ncbi:MAG: hypothetical protein E7371_04190 [Clostridiales bacterium]|nr:hypothetical protein [Clostridiales bacterium]
MARKQSTPFPYMTVLGIDMRRGAFHQYNVLGDDVKSVVHTVQNYTGASFTEDFYKKFANVVEKFVENNPSETVRQIAFVVPDEVAALDNVRLPTLRSHKLIKNLLDTKLSEIYLNRDDLEIRTFQVEKNRQYCTYSVTAIQEKVLNSLYTVCSENKLYADVLTYASASTVTAVATLNPKWKNESYLFLDIKDVYSRFIFVADGRCVGSYPLPFGMEFLSTPKYVQEDMLFDHSMAELTVLNARERAKSKKLSVLDNEHVGEMTESVNLDAMMSMNNDWDDDDEDMKPVKKTVAEEVAVTEITAPAEETEAVEEPAPTEEVEKTEEPATEEEPAEESEKAEEAPAEETKDEEASTEESTADEGEATEEQAVKETETAEASATEETTPAEEPATEETTPAEEPATEENTPAEENETTEQPEPAPAKAKVMAKKIPRKLPLFMQRPTPETEQDITKENFRVFVKWTLSLIQSNPKLTAFGAPKFVCVNLPKDMQFIIDGVNLEAKENGLPFVRFEFADDNADLAQNLELFGGLYGNNWHISAKF